MKKPRLITQSGQEQLVLTATRVSPTELELLRALAAIERVSLYCVMRRLLAEAVVNRLAAHSQSKVA